MANLIGALVSGFFLFNAIPHLVQGILGKRHMTPFSRESAAVINVIWGWINIIVGVVIMVAAWPGKEESALLWWVVFSLGGLIISLYLAVFWSNPDARLPWHKK